MLTELPSSSLYLKLAVFTSEAPRLCAGVSWIVNGVAVPFNVAGALVILALELPDVSTSVLTLFPSAKPLTSVIITCNVLLVASSGSLTFEPAHPPVATSLKSILFAVGVPLYVMLLVKSDPIGAWFPADCFIVKV